jgi:hypothetical protein
MLYSGNGRLPVVCKWLCCVLKFDIMHVHVYYTSFLHWPMTITH